MLEINKKTRAAAQTTQAFNSMCRFGDKLLGATDSGLFSLGGYNDHGVQIPARIDSGMFDLGVHNKKRFRFFYFELNTNGSLKLRIFGDGVLAAEHAVESKNDGGIQRIRIPISSKVSAHLWSWSIENIDGSFFSLYSIKCLPLFMHQGAS